MALGFDGINDRVTIEDDPRLQLTQSLTLEAIVRIDSYANSGPIVWRGDDRAGLDPYAIQIRGDDVVDPNFRRTIEFFFQPEGGQRIRIIAPAPPLGEVFHVAGTLDNTTGAWKLFINGVVVAETTTNLRPFAQLDASQRPRINFGNIDQGGVSYFKGVIDEIRISDVALDPSQFAMPVWHTKFYTVDDASTDRMYKYHQGGGSINNYQLNGNTAPRGAASTAAGDKVWVVDANKEVYIYDTNGQSIGSWTAGSLSSTAQVEGITTNGADVWIVDANSDKVYKYSDAAGLASGSLNSSSNFKLNGGNKNPKDIVTDGAYLYVVNDTNSSDKVFKYTLTGSFVGSWTIATSNAKSPTGITLDPSNPSHLWIVDNGTDRVYQYDNAVTRNSGSLVASTSFALAAGNTNPQGIADPPPPGTRVQATTANLSPASLSLAPTYDQSTPTVVTTTGAGLCTSNPRNDEQREERLNFNETRLDRVLSPSENSKTSASDIHTAGIPSVRTQRSSRVADEDAGLMFDAALLELLTEHGVSH